ncbi:hemicentin-1-like [Huso huso]|uniref:Hemicentin-1-like n=1 Tax=Huso huso TaxID=61971 RepID=A0ABR0Z7Y1_HUSHU
MGCLWTLWCGLALVFTHCCCPHALALPRLGSDPSPAEGASSLAFVFDVTGSMYDDLQQVVEGASGILEKSLSRRRRPIQNFVLVPFHDPEIGPVSITTDPEQFQRDLRELFVQGGGDCPEMSVGAIKKALEVSFPGSFIYVFTDARAKDYRLKQDVLQLVQLKQSQVVFVLTGDCGDRSQPGYKAYEEIAATSSGQIFHLDKQQVNEVLKWVEETVQAMKVHLVSTDHESGEENEWSVPFDPSLKEVTVSLSGPEPEIELRDPFGRRVGKELGLTELLNIPNSARVVSVKHPRPGTWTLKVRCSGRHTLRVTGVSPLDFRAGFSSHPTRDFAQTRERPVQGIPAHVLLNCTGLSPPGHVSRMELLSASGRSLRALSVLRPPDRGSSGLWNIPEFRSPSESFFLKLNGKDKDGYSFQRLSSVSYTNIIPDPPAVSMPSRIQGYYLQPTVIGCSVESSAPFRLRVTGRGGARLGEERIFQGSANTTWEIPKVSGKDEGFYECVASGNAGVGRAQTYLSVSEPPPALELPRNVTAPPGGVAVLSCQAGGSVRYNLTWQRGGEEVGGWTGRVRILSNSSLEIDPVTPQDAGQYHCVASNDQGESRAAVWLLVPEPPRVQVSPQTQTFLRGAEVRVACTAAGSPTPQIFWRHGDTFVTHSGRTSASEHGILIIKDAAPEHAGSYTCLASNDVGTDMQSATLSYTETPSITVLNRSVLVAAGEEAILECKAAGVPPPLVTWYKGDLLVGTLPLVEEDARRGTLRIGGVQEMDAGEYSCVASSQAGTSSAMVVLNVGAPPEFSETPADVTVEVGQNVTLACSARGYPAPQVTWQRQDGEPLYIKPDSLSNVFQLETGALLIESVWLDDEGLYVCEAQNQFGLIRTEVRITVTGLEPPLLAEVAPVISTLIGRSLTLSCVLLDGNPPPKRHWTHNGQPVSVSSRVSLQSDGSLYIDKVSQEDAGIFVCMAVNLAGSANVSITVSIPAAPTISSGPSHYITNEGVAVTLSCDSTGEPKPTTVWSKGREAIRWHSSRYRADASGSLMIPSPGAEDSGVYVCTATNPAGYASREMQLSVNTKPRIGGGRNLTEPIRISAAVGSEVTLPCEVQGSPTPLVTWSRDGYPVPPITARFTVLSSGSLRVSDSRVTDSAEYKCSVVNPAGKTSLIYTLHVQVAPRIQPVPRLLKAVIGQELTLPCEAYGEPAPQISWFRNGAPVGEGGSLIIREVAHSSAGEYRCVALNSAGQEALEVTLEVLEPPSFADVGDVIVEELAKKRVTLPCPVQGSPTPAVRWFKNGLELSDSQSGLSTREDGSLVIGSAKSSHSGEYKCIATNEAGSAERRSRLSVNVPPEIQEDGQPLNRTVSLHQSLTLGCEASGTPSPDIIWLKDGQPIPESSGIWMRNGGGTLRILRVRMEDAGRYSCRAASKAGEAERRFHVGVQAPPVISRTGGTQDLSVTIGQEVEFHCRVSGLPLPFIEWSKDGEVLSRQGDPHVLFSEHGQVMKVKSARLRDQGRYQCLAINAAGKQARDFRLTVHAPPSIRGDGERSEVSVVQGNPTVLSCEAEGMPAPSITWLKEGRPIVSSARVSYGDGGRALLLGAVRDDDAGLYTCRASNSAGSSERSYSLRVLVPPQIEGDESGAPGAGSREVKVRINSLLSLSCQSRAFPAPTTQWYKEGQRVESAPGVHIKDDGRSLRMENARLSDGGRYTCVASNTAGEDRRDFHVSIQVPPVFQRVNGGPAAWELGEREEEEEMTDLREVVLSSPVSLSCESNAIPAPRLSWHRDGKEISNNDRVRLLPGGHVLQIPRVRVEDAGRYTCQAVNEAGEDRMHYELVVLVPPEIHDEAGEFVEEVGVVVNSTAQLRCKVSGSPAPAISWLKDGLPLYNSPRHQILEEGMLLQMTAVQLTDTAAYVCLAENKVGSTERLYSVTVQVPPRIVGLNPDKASVLEGHMVSLMCDVQAYPSPEITWSREGRPLVFSTGMHILPGGQMLQISRARLSDAGRYECTAINPAGQDQKHIELSVYAPPTLKPRPSPDQDVLNPSAGASITLHCEAEGVPEPEVTWYRNGLQLEPGNGLQTSQHGLEIQLSQAQIPDSGVYTCVARSRAGAAELSYSLQVQVPPAVERTEPLEQVTVVSGSSVTFTCEARGVPPPSLSWFKDSQSLSLHRNLLSDGHETRLHLPAVSLPDSGLYACIAANQAGRSTKHFNLTVLEPPKISSSGSPQEVSVTLHSSLELECTAIGTPPPRISWLKDGRRLERDGVLHRQGELLRIHRVQVEDAGLYTCLASSEAGEDGRNHWVQIQVPPNILGSSDSKSITALANGQLTLECQSDTDPPPAIQWFKDDIALQMDARVQSLAGGQFLEIQEVSPSDSGQYSCVATNIAGSSSLVFLVSVHVAPLIKAGSSLVTANVNQPALLPCEVEGSPSPTVTWRKDGSPISHEHTRFEFLSDGSLRIRAAQISDAGRYHCTASNPAGSNHRGIDLVVHVAPSIHAGPVNVTVTASVRASLNCETTGIPRPQITWTKNGVPLNFDLQWSAYRLLSSGSLVITSPTNQDAGQFECTATNEAGEERRVIEVTVQVPPSIADDSSDVTVTAMSPAVLSCHATGQPEPEVSWTKGGAKLGNRGGSYRVLPTGTLEITAAVPSHAGRYTCFARNVAGVAYKHMTLAIQEPPVVRPMAEAVEVVLHHGIVLPCEVGGFPRPSITWQREGVPVGTGSRLTVRPGGALQFSRVTAGDAGVYLCVAQNEAGTALGKTRLIVQVPGGYSNWMEWSPCSVTCGQGVQERIRLCNNPVPANGGGPCEGRDRDSRSCQTARCPDAVPLRAKASLIGMINEREFGVAFLEANVTENEEEGSSTVRASIENIPHTVGPLMRVLVTMFAPIYWTTAFQTGTSRNGFSLTQGVFRQESQVEFGTGEVLRLTHVARGLDAEGVLLVDIVINGFIPKTMAGAQLALQDFNESYTQTGEGQLYAWSSQRLLVDGAPQTLRCNHTVVFEGGRGPLLQLLRVRSFTGSYRHRSQEMSFQFSTSLRTDGSGDRCPGGFVLDSASYCADENECALESPCSHSCHNFMGSFSCACPSGFTLAPDTSTCQDIDECSQGTHMCHYNQQCVNTPGTYRCLVQCGHGFKPNPQGNGCEDLNECKESIVSPCQQQCLNTAGSFRCACEVGYRLAGKRCEDINECTMNVCPAHQQCRNTDGSYQCIDSCPAGMTQAGNGACVDVDECEDGTHMCRYSQVCENTIGGYRCSCPRGYRSQGVGRPCLDIDECQQVPRPCAFQCRNVAGSFRCLCPSGAALLGDGRSCAGLERTRISLNATGVLARLRPQLVSSQGGPSFTRVPFQPPDGLAPAQGGRTACPRGYAHRGGSCIDVDECLQRKPCQHDCRNTQGSYQCTCPSGYQLLPNGRNCKDVDECVEQGVTCAPSQMCFNTRGGHQCLDTPCPASYQRGVSPGSCIRSCSLDCSHGGPLSLQYKLLTLPLGIPANHNVIRLSAFSDSGVLQEHTVFRVLEQAGEVGGQLFGIREEGGRGIIYTLRALQHGGLAQLRVQATTHTPEGQVKYQSVFIIYIAISHYPF